MNPTTLPLSDLRISKSNVRYASPDKIDTKDIEATIPTAGIIQPILVAKNGSGYEVIAGRRRFLAAKRAGLTDIPVHLCTEKDARTQRELSLIENVVRSDMPALDVYHAMSTLVDKTSATQDALAKTFNVTQKEVRKYLAIGSLDEKILELSKTNELSDNDLFTLTLATPDQQKQFLKMSAKSRPRHNALRNWITGAAFDITTGNELFDTKTVKLTTAVDLFRDRTLYLDPPQYWAAQLAAMEEQRSADKANGWPVRTIDLRAKGEQQYGSHNYQKQKKADGGEVWYVVLANGKVERIVGVTQPVTPKAAAAAERKAKPKDGTLPPTSHTVLLDCMRRDSSTIAPNAEAAYRYVAFTLLRTRSVTSYHKLHQGLLPTYSALKMSTQASHARKDMLTILKAKSESGLLSQCDFEYKHLEALSPPDVERLIFLLVAEQAGAEHLNPIEKPPTGWQVNTEFLSTLQKHHMLTIAKQLKLKAAEGPLKQLRAAIYDKLNSTKQLTKWMPAWFTTK